MAVTDTQSDKNKIRFVFDLFTQIQGLTYKTEIGQEIGAKVSEAIKEVIKPYMIEKSLKLKDKEPQ
jgi:hypothetical protein